MHRVLRKVLVIMGMGILLAVWAGPLPELAQSAFLAHMAMHMGVVAVVAPLMALGMGGSRVDPVRRAPRLFAPIPASIVELVVVWAWHAPGLHHLARHSATGLLVEQAMFLGSGLLVWLSALGGERSGARIGAGIAALLLTSMHMTLLGALLALAPRPLYAHPGGIAGISALADQHIGGAIMLFIGGVSYLAGGLWLTAELLRMKAENAVRPT